MVVEAQAQAELRLVSVVSVWPHDITHHHPPAHINLTKLFLGNLWSDLSMEEEPDLTDLLRHVGHVQDQHQGHGGLLLDLDVLYCIYDINIRNHYDLFNEDRFRNN